jgi:hypothetical protein
MNPRTIKIAILTLACLGQIQLVSAYVTGLIPWHIFFSLLLCLTALIIVIITSIFDSFRRTRLTKTWTFPIFASLTLGFILGWVLSAYQGNQRRENAERIISALNNYKNENGEYPLTQGDLKPDYLNSIPTSNWGLFSVSFDYQPDSTKKEFRLEYRIETGCGYYYHSSMAEWQFWD